MDRTAREHQLDVEQQLLAPYAAASSMSRGRRYPEGPQHRLRTAFQRDRDRVVHSRSFRRLEYKTQVFVSGTCDHFRTRLTHTIEVSGIARTIARSLRLNEDLAETIALAHDLGHPPFGHCGERELNHRMADHGGFDHNTQALRTVDELEYKYPGFRGLNLTWESRSGLLKHRDTGAELDGIPLPPQPHLEAQVADVADDLTYYSHDLDDGIASGLLDDRVLDELDIWRLTRKCLPAGFGPDEPAFYPYMVRNIIDLMVANVVDTSSARLAASGIASQAEAEAHPHRLVGFSDAFAEMCERMREFLFERVYWHDTVLRDNNLAVQWMSELFTFFHDHPDAMGRKARDRLDSCGFARTVADYIAGMTDRYAIEQYRELVNPAAHLGAQP